MEDKVILKNCRSACSESKYVWYACYGSNICKSRFMKYINRCSDTTPPVDDRPFEFEYNIYFAKSASTWQNGGKAFLDDTQPGKAYGRIYKITRAQYEQVKRKEGSDYKKQLCLGEIDGEPIYSFTDVEKNVLTRTPSTEYFKIIVKGLKECYDGILSNQEIVKYLLDTVFPQKTFRVVRTIRLSSHYISNDQISEVTGLDLERVTAAVTWLVEHNVIQQDSRSIRAGYRVDDPEAFFFTVENPCARELVSSIIDILCNAALEEEIV